jgi:malonyl-CoA/methylmalonyl-CoA synthetase
MPARPQSIAHAFLGWSERTPDAPCIRFDQQWRSYVALAESAMRVASALRDWGLQRGDRVALYLENSPQFLVCYLGVHFVGGVVVPVNTQYRQVELRHILADSGARLCITDAERRPALTRVQAELTDLAGIVQVDGTAQDALSYADLLHQGSPTHAAPPISSADLALIGYTSGTTGRSKGAMLSHGNLVANSSAVTAAWRWTAADRLLLTLPLFHIHGLGVGIHGTFLLGASADLRRRFEASEVYAALCANPPTMFFGVPTMYTRLIAEAKQQQRCPALIRLYVSGSAPLSAQTFAEFQALFGQPILERYGMTETVMNLTNPYDGERRPGTVGMPFPGQEARIVDVRTRQPRPDGEIGEIQVRGPNVFSAYWKQPAATAESFAADGWFHTGDLGWRSADGYFTITGRARELIISGGYNVYPREVEEVLLTHPAVAEAAVFGLPDADLGEQVVAVLVPSSAAKSLGAEELIAFCREQLAAYKKPRQIFFRDTLPRNALGKVQKHVLKEEYGG